MDGRDFTINLRLDPEDVLHGSGQQGMAIELVTDSATVRLPTAQDRPHPDLVALAVLTVVQPWCRQRLTVAGGVSSHFAEATSEAFGIDVGPTENGLSRRMPGQRLGLMYSGGPDCMAAEILLGETLPLIHFRRVKHPRMPDRSTHVRIDVQESLVRQAERRGEKVHVAESDLEYLCRPFPTFPQWVALTIGAVLQADSLNLGGIVTGRNISGMYLGWGSGFLPDGEQEAAWERVYAAAGVPLVQPLAGASDVASKRLAESHRLFDLARSCLLGTAEGPCLNCIKCMMNDLIRAALDTAPLASDWNARYSANKDLVARMQGEPPFHAQHVLEYALARIPNVDETFFSSMSQRLKPNKVETEWVARYYRPALEAHLPESQRTRTSHSIDEHIGFMSPTDERRVEGWDPHR